MNLHDYSTSRLRLREAQLNDAGRTRSNIGLPLSSMPTAHREHFRCAGSVLEQQRRYQGSEQQYVRTGDSGKKITSHFCSECGSTVYYQLNDQPDVIAVPVGAFADPEFPPPRVSVWESRRHAWAKLPNDIEHIA